ncbi:hypothetical protein ACFVS2_25355 [Brevibacillus sp. NPDC058079]|uniref:hypothetical protein n=1 Tax=Brevibacillus sp. NPDC058079 TaxID=3346330 RepID=UPI0036E443C3
MALACEAAMSATNSVILGFLPGTKELIEIHASKLVYASFDRENPENIQFLVTGNDQLVIGCLITKERLGEELFSYADGEMDKEELEDWVDRKAIYTFISALEIWEQYQNKGFGTIAVEQIKESSRFPIALYAVAESVEFWDRHIESMSGYWYSEKKA